MLNRKPIREQICHICKRKFTAYYSRICIGHVDFMLFPVFEKKVCEVCFPFALIRLLKEFQEKTQKDMQKKLKEILLKEVEGKSETKTE